MSRRIKTARGQLIDMGALSAKNERVRAVGKAAMVDAAYAEGVIQTAVQRNASISTAPGS